MMESTQKTGRRAAFAEDVINDNLVREYDQSDIRHARCEVRNKLKWVRQHLNREINLPLSAWYLLDELIGMTHDVDWAGGPLTVWPSNDLMLTWLDVSERQLQILLSKLRQANFICFIDSPTRQRWGRRDTETGRILEAYGIDLRPLAQRVPKLIALAEQAQADRHAAMRARRTAKALVARISEYIRTARREVDDHVEAANDNWSEFAEQLARAAKLIEPKRVGLAVLDAAVDLLRPLEVAVKKAMVRLFRPKAPRDESPSSSRKEISSPVGESKFTHKTTTNPLSSHEDTVGLSGIRVGKSDRANISPGVRGSKSRTKAENTRRVADHLLEYKISISTVIKACPSMAELGDPDLPEDQWTWDMLTTAALASLSIMGVGSHAWKSLRFALGDTGAAVAVAVITEKFSQGVRGAGTIVANPGGYAYWFARTAAELGHLDLGPKIHALLKPHGRSAASLKNHRGLS